MLNRYNIIWYKEIKSTNTYAKEHINTLDNLTVIAALHQTSGKGQGDHTWDSDPGQNLLISVVLKKTSIPANQQKLISDIVATSIVDLLKKHDIDAWIKPPNDIWVDEKKICGILIEHSLKGNNISWSIIGIGLNVNQTAFPKHLPNPTSIAILKEKTNLEDILIELMEILVAKFSSYIS